MRDYFPVMPTADVAKKLRRSQKAVAVKASKMGLKKQHYGIVWTDEMLKRLRDYFPTMFSEDLARWLGVSKRSLLRKARELGLEKIENFQDVRRRDINLMISRKLKAIPDSHRFKPGEHRCPDKEFKPGHKESAETKMKRSEAMKAYWKRRRLQRKYGIWK